jgi:Rps23 Pro-64 3,4-dihydroxylase Tpa1-like proline 4-hydroxylase
LADSANHIKTAGHASVLTTRAEEFAIYDEFLSLEELSALRRYANSSTYHSVHEKGVRKVWRLHDGSPLLGATSYLSADAELAVDDATNPIQVFLARLNEVIDANTGLLGERSTHWEKVSAAPWIYPAGTGLSLHADRTRYTGSYTFFLHRQWGLHWGGYLMIFNPTEYCGRPAARYVNGFELPWLSDEAETKEFEHPGLAISVFAKPNRLVLIAPTAYHMVTRVDSNAGQNARISVAGFFHKSSSDRTAGRMAGA